MTPTIVVLSMVLLAMAALVFGAAVRSWRQFAGAHRLIHEGDGLTEAEDRMRQLTESALAPRPAWRVRIMVEGQSLPAMACYRVPVGLARDEKEAVNYIRRRYRHAREGYPRARWLAFPVVGEERQQEQRSGAGTA